MTQSDSNNNNNIEEAFKALSGAEKKFVNTYIESGFDKIKAVKVTLKPDKEYHQDHFRRKASVFFHRPAVKHYLSLYFQELKSEHSAKVQQLLDYLTEKAFDDSEDADIGTKRQSIDILSKYLLLDNDKKSLDITSGGKPLNISISYE